MDLVNDAKAKPGKINFGHAGIGSGTHLNTEKFIAAAGIKVTQVPFKGTPEVVAAMFSGNVDAYWAPISAALSQHQGRQAAPARGEHGEAQRPRCPTCRPPAKPAFKGADSPLWFGAVGPGRHAAPSW